MTAEEFKARLLAKVSVRMGQYGKWADEVEAGERKDDDREGQTYYRCIEETIGNVVRMIENEPI